MMKVFVFKRVLFILCLSVASLNSFKVSAGIRKCRSQSDCSRKECCVISGFVYTAIGKCQELGSEGTSCRRQEEKLEFNGGKYVGSCPCKMELICMNTTNHYFQVQSTCTKNYILPKRFRRDVSDDSAKDELQDASDGESTNDEESKYDLDSIHDSDMDTLHKSISATEDTELDDSLRNLWDSDPPKEFNDWKNEEPIAVEDKKPITNKNPTHDIQHAKEIVHDIATRGNGLEENLRNLIQSVMSSINKRPGNDHVILHHEIGSKAGNGNQFSPNGGSHGKRKDNSLTSSPLKMYINNKTFPESAKSLNSEDIMRIVQSMMNAKSNHELVSKPKPNDMTVQKPPIEDRSFNQNDWEEQPIFKRTKSPLEIEWDKATIESKLPKNPLSFLSEHSFDDSEFTNQKESLTTEANVAKETFTTPISHNNHEPEKETHWLQEVEITDNGKVNSQQEDSIIRLHYSKDGHDGSNNYEYPTEDPNADYMDEF